MNDRQRKREINATGRIISVTHGAMGDWFCSTGIRVGCVQNEKER